MKKTENKAVQDFTPEKILIVYGTLAPGRPNHAVLEPIRGFWQKGIVRGKLEDKGWGAAMGYPGFRPVPSDKQEDIEAYILFSDDLPSNWPFLDEFEGNGYRRILADFELDDGQKGAGFVYALNDEQESANLLPTA